MAIGVIRIVYYAIIRQNREQRDASLMRIVRLRSLISKLQTISY